QFEVRQRIEEFRTDSRRFIDGCNGRVQLPLVESQFGELNPGLVAAGINTKLLAQNLFSRLPLCRPEQQIRESHSQPWDLRRGCNGVTIFADRDRLPAGSTAAKFSYNYRRICFVAAVIERARRLLSQDQIGPRKTVEGILISWILSHQFLVLRNGFSLTAQRQQVVRQRAKRST